MPVVRLHTAWLLHPSSSSAFTTRELISVTGLSLQKPQKLGYTVSPKKYVIKVLHQTLNPTAEQKM